MIKRIKYILYLLSYLIFVVLITSFYLSDQNVNKINKSRAIHSANIVEIMKTLPLLKSDTRNIVVYRDDVEVFKKKKKKYKFFELLK